MRRPSPIGLRPARVHRITKIAGLFASAVLLAACSNTTAAQNNSGTTASGETISAASVDQKALATTIRKALLADVPISGLDPVVADTLAAASIPLTPEQNKLLDTCLRQSSCDTGRGTLTIGIDASAANNPWWNIRRAEATAQAIAYPQVKRIIYTSSANGNIAEVLANIRSLITQRVDVIVEDPVFGSAILPAVQQAKQAGVAFVTANSPLPADTTSQTSAQFPFDVCTMAKSAAGEVAKSVGQKSTYALYTGIPGNAVGAEWQPCAQQTLDQAGWTQAVQGFTQWTPQGTAQAASALLATGKDVGAIFSDDYVDDFMKPYIVANKPIPVTFNDTPRFSSYQVFDNAKKANLNPVAYVANGHVWYGRLAVTAGVMIKSGQQVAPKIVPPIPVVSLESTLDLNVPGAPANVPLSSLLTADQMQLALSVS